MSADEERFFLDQYIDEVDTWSEKLMELAVPERVPAIEHMLHAAFSGWCEALEEHGIVADRKAIQVGLITASAILAFEHTPPLPGASPALYTSMILRKGLP